MDKYNHIFGKNHVGFPRDFSCLYFGYTFKGDLVKVYPVKYKWSDIINITQELEIIAFKNNEISLVEIGGNVYSNSCKTGGQAFGIEKFLDR